MKLRLVFWRHGQTAHNVSLRIQGAQDLPLNDVGHAQAAAAAPELAKLAPARIYSSDLQRAVQTAEYLASEVGQDIRLDTGLRERSYGVWEGMTSDEIREGYPEQWLAWREGREPEGVGVERRDDCGVRVYDAVKRAVAEVREDFGENVGEGELVTVVFVAHGGSISNGIMCMLAQNPSEWVGLQGMDNCHWAILEPRPNAHPTWRLHAYNLHSVDTNAVEHLGF